MILWYHLSINVILITDLELFYRISGDDFVLYHMVFDLGHKICFSYIEHSIDLYSLD